MDPSAHAWKPRRIHQSLRFIYDQGLESPEGPGPFRYRWTFNGTEVAGAANATLRLATMTGAAAGDYTVDVITESGMTKSRARLTVSQPSLAPPPIRIGRVVRLNQDRVRLAVDGENGLVCLIRVSDGLMQWKDLARAVISAANSNSPMPTPANSPSDSIRSFSSRRSRLPFCLRQPRIPVPMISLGIACEDFRVVIE